MSVSEIITDGGRRRHWSTPEKLRIVEETLDGRESISVVARRNGVAPNLLYRWRRLMLEGGSVAVAGDDDVTSNRQVREMETRIRELERQLGRKTLEVEILKEALERSRQKKRACSCTRRCRRLSGEPGRQDARGRALDGVRPPYRRTRTRGPYAKADDANLLPRIRQIAAQRPTYGYRRIAAVLNRQQRAEGLAPVNHKRVYRIMAANRLLLARRYTERADYGHDGVVVAIRSNLRWCSDGFEFTCWNGEVVRGAFIIDAHDREIIAWRAVANAGISGSDVRDIMLEAVETRLAVCARPCRSRCCPITARPIPLAKHAPLPGNWASNPASRPSAARSPTASRRPSFHTLKRDYVRVSPLPMLPTR